MRAERTRTGFSFQRALKGNSVAKKAGLNSGILYSWLPKKGECKIKYQNKVARKDHIKIARTLWAKIPDKEKKVPHKRPKRPPLSSFKVAEHKRPSHGYEPVTQAYLDKLAAEERRTGVPTRELIKIESIDVSIYTVNGWRTKSAHRTKSADPKIMDQLLEGYSKLPDVKKC